MNYDELLAPAAKSMRPSGIRKFFDLAAEMPHCISLGVGEPDFKTPWTIRDAGIRSLEQGRTRYTANAGIKELRAEICRYLARRMELNYQPSEVLVTVGGSEAIDLTIRALVKPGDEVIIPTPCWVSYSEIVKLVGATPVYVPCAPEENFDLNLTGIRSAISSRTKAILINTPNNPTGAVYSEQTLRALGELAVEHGFTIISDEIYEKMVYDGAEHISTASLSPEIYRHCITINGFSKAYAMPGWRIGYSAAPLEVTTAIKAVQGHVTSAANSIAQKAALEALSGPQDTVAVMCGEYARRRSRVAQLLQEIPGVRFSMPSGAFYFWVDVSAYLGKSHGGKKINTAVDLANFLLEQAHAAVVPGEAFHMPGSIRISYANSMKNIELALTAIKEALALL